jgi:hypothetical protein
MPRNEMTSEVSNDQRCSPATSGKIAVFERAIPRGFSAGSTQLGSARSRRLNKFA